MIHTLGLSPSLDVVYGVDAVVPGRIHRPTSVLRLAGGKSLNVSRALARLGADVRAVVPLGGHLGDLVAQLLAPTGVELVRVTSSTPTRMCVSVGDEQAQTLTEFYEHAEAADGSELEQVERALAAVPAGEWLMVSGSVPAGVDARRLALLLGRCSARGVRLAVDVHGPALALMIKESAPAVVKINRGEAAELVGSTDDLPGLGVALRRLGPDRVVITDGAAGAVGWQGGGAWAVRTAGPAGGFPVGSGDCFLAGLVWALAAGEELPGALVGAAAVGAANAAVLGGAVFEPRTVAELRRRTTVVPLRVGTHERG